MEVEAASVTPVAGDGASECDVVGVGRIVVDSESIRGPGVSELDDERALG